MSAGSQPQQITPETIREVTREVLNRPEFGGPPTWEDIIVSLLEAIRDWLNSLAVWSTKNPDLARILGIVLAVVFVALLAHLLYLALGDLLPFKRRKQTARARTAQWDILEGTGKNWREALAAARRMLKEGNYRRAIWIAHRVLLGLLDEQEAIRFAVWKTNSHYLHECSRTHPWYDTLTELTEVYEQAIYAHRAAPPSSVESLVFQVDQLSKEGVG